ncbi:MAG TPA: LptF/LptG family permease [Paracoccaceae bacterium]|nr:LptF/LptG family permease [Paracoccaceae bacterium]
MKLTLYLTRVLAARIAAATAVLLALGLSLDLLKSADELVAAGGAGALMQYAGLRAPAMGAQILPLGVLVGGLMAFLALGRRSELTVMRAAGQSVFRLLVRLVPLALALGLAQHLMVDRGIAWSERALAEAFAGIADTPAPVEGSRVAGRVGSAVVIGTLADNEGTEIAPIMVYALDDQGQVTGRVEAERAVYRDGDWRLVDLCRVGETPGSDAPDLLWRMELEPETVRALASGQATATASEAAAALSGFLVPTRSADYYRTRLSQARAAVLVPAVMLLCAAFASFKGARGPGGLGLVATGAVLGMGFVVVDGLFGSFGQIGLIPAWAAGWVPAAVFGAAAGWILLLREE